jgi:uncharacterized protein YdhG (YjbR/CyaY superfamily)
MITSKTKTIDEFIHTFPLATQKILKKLKETIHKAAPKATEAISYGIPTFKMKGNLVHFSGYKTHIGFYPGPQAITAFKKELSAYKQSRGAVQFPLDAPIPWGLVRKIVQYRVKASM